MNSSQKIPSFWQKILAWSVHLFTASGAAWGLLAVVAIYNHEWKEAMLWMVMAIFVDGVDGWLARWAQVKSFAPEIDGALLDNILDYFNYVLVPGLFLYEAKLLPAPFALAGIILIALTSAFQFAQTDAKTDDHYFKGFPSYWNVMAIYLLILGLNPWLNLAIIVILNILVFVPIKYVYPSRTARRQNLTLILTSIWGGIGIVSLFQYPQVHPWFLWSSLLYISYYIAISVFPSKKKTI
ncbi:MAG: CDP-alcohol phosphatidyltransferase family protein [Anaerolineales bacterium]|nr:CDP-alcohol phosphatidyltransferase family protein [Anaerolineales bacterium]